MNEKNDLDRVFPRINPEDLEIDGNIAVGFNTGNIITIQSTDLLSAAISLSNGSAWRFNHVTKAWQSA